MKKNFNHNLRNNQIKTIFKATKKSLRLFFGISLLISGSVLAYSSLSADSFEVKTINIFPAKIEGEGWNNIETISFQNLDEYALLQEFNSINSATFDLSKNTQNKLTDEERETESDQEDADSPTEELPEVIFDFSDPVIPLEDSLENTQATRTSTTISSPVDDLEQDPQLDENSDTSSTTVLRKVESFFALALSSVTSIFDTSSSTDSEEETDSQEELPEADFVVDEENEIEITQDVLTGNEFNKSSTSDSSTSADNTDGNSGNSEDIINDQTGVNNDEMEVDESEDTEAGSSSDSGSDTDTEEDYVETEIADDCISDCVPYVITLSDFGFPLEPSSEISGSQLRVSFAAEKKSTREHIPSLKIRYSIDGGAVWMSGGSVIIEDQVSNSINGGYLLFDLSDVSSQESLDLLQVQLVYNDDPEILKEIYIESVWLEMFTLEPSKDIQPTNLVEILANDGFNEGVLSGDELELASGEIIEFEFTDNNDDETLIIKSEKETYQGISETTTYFSVTNTSESSDEFSIQTYFPEELGVVDNIQMYNVNKPYDVLVPEYRPYVYNCEAGWDYEGELTPQTLEDLSRELSEDLLKGTEGDSESTQTDNSIENSESDNSGTSEEVIFDIATSSVEIDLDLPKTDNTTTTVLNLLKTTSRLLLASSTKEVGSEDDSVLDLEKSDEEQVIEDVIEEDVAPVYSCRNTNVLRECDEIDGGNTACIVNQVKVAEHETVRYTPGWEKAEISEGSLPKPGFFKRVAEFIGFGPDRKEIPKEFEVRSHTADYYPIEPGETKYFKMDISFPSFTEGEYWIEAVGKSEYGLLDPFWASDWDYRIPITIDNTDGKTDLTEYQVFLEISSALTDFWSSVQSDGGDIRFAQQISSGNFSNAGTAKNNWFDTDFGGRVPVIIPPLTVTEDQVNFPVYVDLSLFDAGFWSAVKADGGDIRVTRSDGTELAIDVVEINTGAETGELHFLADTIVANAANTFYVYYDNIGASGYSASDPLGSESVWSTAGYQAVYHFKDDPSSLGNTLTDETGQGNDLTVTTASPVTTTGQMGTAYDFNGVSGYLENLAWTFEGGDPLITTGLYKMASADNSAIWQWGTAAQPDEMEFRPWYTGSYTNGTGLHYFGATSGATYAFPRATSSWHAFGTIGTTSAADNNLVYEDGVLVESVPQTIGNTTNNNVAGFSVARTGTNGWWDGQLDELRIATTTRSEEWVEWETINLSDPTHFYTINDSQVPENAANLTWYSTSWLQRLKFSIPQAKIDSNLVDFPVYLDLSTLGNDFWSGVQNDGSDIRITTGDGVTELSLEVVSINTGTKTGEVYFKTDLYRNSPNDFYVYYENEDSIAYDRTDTYGSDDVWSNGFVAVYHLEEDAAGTSNPDVYKDSTSNQYDGDDFNTSNDKTGLFGRGQEFGDDQNDYLSLPYQVLNGLTNISTSWWHNTSNPGDMTITSGANSGQANEYWDRFNSNNRLYIYSEGQQELAVIDGSDTYNDGTWQYYMAIRDYDNQLKSMVRNGVLDAQSPITSNPLIDIHNIDNGGLIIGQDQDTVGGSFSTAENFEGLLDELRYADVVRDPDWGKVEYANMGDYATFISTSSSERLQVTDFVELDFWIQHFDDSSDEADIWVQVASVPAGEVSTIYMYYGSTGATSASDELATFSYSTSTDIYYVVDDHGAASISIQSLIDNNEISLDGGIPVPLDQGERTTFSISGGDSFDGDSVISVLGPISGTIVGSGSDGSDTLAPIAFASTSFAIPTSRSVNQWFAYSPFASSTVKVFQGASASPMVTLNVATGTSGTANANITDTAQGVDGAGAVVESTSPILLAHRHTTQGDGMVMYPPTMRDLFGVTSNYMHLSALRSNSDPTVYCSTGAGGTVTGITRGDQEADSKCTSAADGSGSAVRVTNQSYPVSAIQQADGDGNESTVYWPQHEFGTRYYMTNDSAYAAVVCSPRFGAVSLEVQDSTGNLVESSTCSPSGNNPGKAYFTNGTGNGSTVNFTAGHQIVSTNGVPFYVIYEDVSNEQDEKNIVGSVQARKFDGIDNRTVEYGAQEAATVISYDDDMNQLSFAWYENTTSQTPIDRWPINVSEDAGEGVAISGSGAVEEGDILRLRLNMQVSNATATAQSSAFSLQYASAPESAQCSLATNWSDLGDVGSDTAIFSGYNNTGLSDGQTLSSTTLALSTVAATYEERNYSDFIPNEIGVGEVGEWDWVIVAGEVDINTTYCFRMVRATGHEMTTYTKYPELITVGPPNTPTNLVYFDDEHTTELIPVLEFVAIDLAGDDITYQVQVDDDETFSSVDIDRNSDDNVNDFENLTTTSDKTPFTSGELIRFTAPVSVSSSTTYWWRVRGVDPGGSATTSEWSTPTSFTTNQTLQTSEWFQTTGAQFDTNVLTSLTTAAGSVSVSGSLGTMVGTSVDFDDAAVGNSWAEADWSDTESSGQILVQVQYNNNGSWDLVPDSLIVNNSIGTSDAPINLRELDSSIYNELRLVATFDGTTLSLSDWTIRWGLRVETPTLGDLFDNQKTVDTLPVFDFDTVDPQEDGLEYEISFSTDKTFVTSSSTYNSNSDPGFSDPSTGSTTSPFDSGNNITYSTQGGNPFSNGSTYWWKVRAKDPNGDNSWSPWSNPDSFTVDTGISVSTWYQTTRGQFEEGILDGTIASSSGSVVVNDTIGEYGKTTLTNGTWTTITLQGTYNNPVVVASGRYTPLGQTQRSIRVRNKTVTSFEILADNFDSSVTGTTIVDYLVMEAGTWTLEDGGTGKQVIAGTYEDVSDVQSSIYATSGYGADVTFSPAFGSAPAVIATVSSDNDSSWVMAHLNDGDTRNNSPTASAMGLYLGRGFESSVHAPEDIDYIAFARGHGTNNGYEFDADVSASVHDEAPVTAEAFTAPFSPSAPQVVIVMQAAEQGGNGGYAALYAATPPTTSNYYPFIDEDGTGADRAHATESILTLAFENSSGVLKREPGPGLTGTIAGEDIIFSDGSGPKYDNFFWSDSHLSGSEIIYQMEYQVSPGVYALIPDSAIPGNSAGTSASPIDLTNVDINSYPIIRPFATLTCSGSNCPRIDSWGLEWSLGVNMTGTLKEYDRLTNVATGTVKVAVNGVVSGATGGVVSGGMWTLSNVNALAGQTVTVWVDGAEESEEAVGIFVYDGLGDMAGVELFEQHISISSDEQNVVTNADIGDYDNFLSGNEDIFFDVDVSNNLVVCSAGSCSGANIYVGPGNTYVPNSAGGVSVTTHDFVSDGFTELDSNTFNISGSWVNNATSSTDTSTINFTATTGTESISSIETPMNFHTLFFGTGAGGAIFTLPKNLDLSGNLTVASGTLSRDDIAISLAGNLTTGTAGFWSGSGTTTFDGAGARTWRDDNPVTQKIGDVLIDGASTNVTAQTNVGAYDIRIGGNDRLNGSTGKTIYVAGDWENNGTFSAQSGTVEVVNDDRIYPPVVPGSQDWYADGNFDSRIMIGVNSAEVNADLTNFPLYVKLSTLGNVFWSGVASDGKDIRVTSGDGQTELPHDLVAINKTAKTGELHFLADFVDNSTTTYFFIYFNNPTASAYYSTDTYGSEAVWSDYEAVYHFKDDPTEVDNYIFDATSNYRNLLVEDDVLATSTGQLGLGINLIGSNGILRNAGFTWTAGNPLVTSGWYKMPAASNESLWQFGTGASPDNLEFRPWYQTTNGLHYFGVTSGATYSLSPRDTTNWLHFTTIGATSTSQNNLVYQNSILVESIGQTIANPYNNGATGLQIGRNGTTNSLQAQIDELRITTLIRSGSWVQSEYSNQYNPTNFYSTTSVQSYTPDLVIDEATHDIDTGGSSFYNLIMNDATTTPAFTEPSVLVSGNFTISTGTVALPTGILTVGRSFINNGYFMHNNAEVKFTSTIPSTITLNGTQFLNAFYNVTFSGAGTWTFTDANATSSNDVVINNGTVIFPTGVMNIGGTLDVNGGGFNANGGTVSFTSAENEDVTTKNSSFNNVVFGINDSSSGWYDIDWGQRIAIRIASTSVAGSLSNFPVYVDLSSLGSEFWTGIELDGSDIRITTSDGKTEVPVELAEISYGLETGELYFLAPYVSQTSDTTFYLYFDNSEAVGPSSGSTYGSEAVWFEYEAVYHFNEDPTTGVTDVSGKGKDLAPTVGTPSTTVGILGTALDTTAASVMLEDSDWTWTAGEDLVSSGLYFMSNFDTGALWEFGSACTTDDCLAYLPWYDNATRGYNRFGETSGNDFNFARDNSEWHHFTTNGRATDGEPVQIFEDSIPRGSYLQSAAGQNPTQTGLQIGRYTTGTYMDVDIDELRFATTTRSQQWITTEYNNLTNVDNFYTTSPETYIEAVPSFSLDEATTDVNGDITIYYANLVAPSTRITIGGSALNVDGSYDPNNATTTFDSNDVGETVEFGDGAFYNLSFNGAGGGWTIASTTVLNNASLVTGNDFTLSPNTTLSVAGRFRNVFSSAATTWTDSTLILTGGDYVVTDRLDSGDDYARLIVSGDSDLVIWNSSISTSTVRDTSSLYLPDFNGVDGDLRIYGEYKRLSGTEYWSYDTDFDGTSLTGGGERQVDVSVGRGASLAFATGTTFVAEGISGATTTVSAITGIYSLNINAGAVDARYASFQNIGPRGLYLTNGTTVTNLSNLEFAVSGGRSGITVDADTVNAQPSSEYAGVTFGTSSANSIYEPQWSNQVVLTIQSGVVNEDMDDYPVYVDLSLLGDDFWSGVRSDGGDIRVTTDNGTELPIDLVEINSTTKTGELYFLASSISSNNDMVFYIHFDNPTATEYSIDEEFGANAVWVNYEAVYHFDEDPTISITDMTGNGRDLFPTVGTMATTTGLLGTALDTTAGNARVENVGWTWTPGDDLISSGLYFQTAVDSGALWQFGSGNGSNNGTYLAFMPWYSGTTRGYHRVGVTNGSDYDYARNNSIWHHFTTIGRAGDGELVELYEDNVLRDSTTQITSSANPSNTSLRIGAYQNTTYMDIDVDELRFATEVPSTNRMDAEYLNFTDPASFYSTSSAQTTTYNVTTDGVPSTFWLFSDGTGNIYGEAFDNDDGDPGSIQWDDSNFSVTISGVVYSDDGVTPETFPVCNGSTDVVTIVLDGVTTYKAPCNPVDGTYEVTGIVYTGEPQITAFIESAAGETQTNVKVFDETTGVGTVSSNIMTVTRPAVVDDSVLVLIAGKDDDINFGTAAGWTAMDIQGVNSDDQIAVGIWYKVVSDASTEPATYDFPIVDAGEEFNYWMGSLLNVDTGTPVDVVNTWEKHINEIAPNAHQITTVTNGALVLSAWYVDSEVEVTPPVYGWQDRARNVVGVGLNNLTVSSQLFKTAGPTGSSTLTGATLNSDPYVGQFAFRPASSPTATGSIVAAVVTKTPLGNFGSPYDIVTLRDNRVNTGTVNSGANIIVNRPVVENGDVLVMIISREDDFTVSGPAGWVTGSEIIETNGNDMYSSIWYKVVTNAGSEPDTYDFLNNDPAGTEEYSYWIGSFDGVDINNVFDVSSSWSNLQNTSSPSAPGITTVTNGAYVIAGWYVIDDSSLDMPGAPWKTLADDIQTGSRLLAVAGRSMISAGSTGAATLTNGSTDDVNVGQFALRPAAISVANKLTDMDFYKNRVIVRHENIDLLTIADMATYDNGDQDDLPFTASVGAPDLLTVLPGSGLVVWNNRTFDSGGEILLSGTGSTPVDGSMLLNSSATLLANASDDITIGGSLYLGTGATLNGATSNIDFTSTNPGQQIGSAASSTITLNNITFTGVGGGWAVQTPLVSATNISVSNGTISGVANITLNNGSFSGNGTVNLTGGTTLIKKTNTLGGTNPWTFNNLTLGASAVAGITTPAGTATTSVRNILTIAAGHFLDSGNSVWDLQGNGNTLVESGTLLEDTSTFRFSGATPNIKQTPYYNLVVDTDRGGAVVATAPITGLQVLNNLRVGAFGTSTLNANINDPVLSVGKNLYIGTRGTIEGSNTQTLTANGNWDNDGVFNANGGTVTLSRTSGGGATVAAGNSSFAKLNVLGTVGYTFTENATTTGNMLITTGTFTLNPGLTLAVGGSLTSTMTDVSTTWAGTTLSLYSGTAFRINTKATGETYNNIVTANGTHPRLWNSTTTSITTNGVSSVYSMDHQRVDGSLYIYGDYVNSGYNDYWSYSNDFDGSVLGVKRQANVRVEAGGSILYPSGTLYAIGTSSASTTISAQTAGTYNFTVSGDTEVDMNYYKIRDTTIEGLVFSGSPDVTDLSYGDFEVAIDGGSTMTVGGSVIDVNPAKEFNFVRMATTTAINAYNVTATGTSNSAWRFVNVIGNLNGEAKDVDPGGDPGYLTWQDSAAIINISGTVYSDEGTLISHACDSTTGNIYLSINGSTYATTTCNGDGSGGGTGVYTFTGINYGLGNTLTVYINNEPEKATTVTQDPVSSISNFDLYENRVIIKHEGGAPMTVAEMGTWDSDDDSDVLFDVETTGTDTLTLPADTKLIVWNNKGFAPGGNVIIPGGGGGSSYDGTLELRSGATFTGGASESYTIGGSMIMGSGSVFNPSESSVTFTSSVAGRTVDTNESGFYDVIFNGSGDWTLLDTIATIDNDFTISNGDVTLPSATTSVSGSFDNTGGTFDSNNGILDFNSAVGGNSIKFGGSDANVVKFTNSGSWSFTDVNATTTKSLTVYSGTVTLPSGTLTVGENFVVNGTVVHNSGTLRLIGSGGGNLLTLSGSNLSNLRINAGAGDYTLTNSSAALTGDLLIETGTFTAGNGTLSIAGSFDATSGVFENNSGTVLFNSGDAGELIDPGSNEFFNVVIAGAGGGWTVLDDATTTNNFTLSTGSSFTMSSGTVLYVGGVFTNTLGGSATQWQGSTVVLDGTNEYETNIKTTPTERYNVLILGSNSDISSWNSSATSTSIPLSSSWYSQDHNGVDGSLYIYGDYHIATTTEYWSRATDFDGASLGSPRTVNVSVASSSNVYIDGGRLNMIGSASGTTTVSNQGIGRYSFFATSGTVNYDSYSFRNLDSAGLQMTGNINVISLDNGDFELAQNNSKGITINSNTINQNASLIIEQTRFASGGFTGGVNVSLDATTTNSWNFTGSLGNIWGEAFDIDGTDDCSSIRWDDSACLLTEQTSYRWRNDDGGEGALASTWLSDDFTARKRVRVINSDTSGYTDVPVKITVEYDADMQTDFDDIRFTDATGVTEIDYWIEKYVIATDANIWVKVPVLATSSATEIYMYYGDVSTTTTSDITNVFNAYDDFEDNNITEYSGETTKFATAGTYAYGGGYGLDASPNKAAKALDGIGRTDFSVSQGEIIRYMQYVDTSLAGSGDEVCTLFGMQSPVTVNQNYAVCLEQFGTDRVSLAKNVQNTDSSGTLLSSKNTAFSTGWYEVEIDWKTNNAINVGVYNSSGALVATTSATDSTYTTGGFGFTFWGQHGGWDSFVSWTRTNTKPTSYIGVEQSKGGASWAAPQDTPIGGFNFGETARLRVVIENTGLPITNQNFRLEFAPKLTAPSCQAVSSGSFVQLPTLASCGSSALCMTTSASTTNNDLTTDHLVTDAGQFVPGRVVANGSNQSSNLDVGQNEYTELEYNIKLTANAVNDAYCFRVTDGGTLLDSYALLPELTLAFDPFLDSVTLNEGLDISLTPGTTTTVIASTTVTDLNGVADLQYATTTFFKSSVGAACTPDNNNCYVASSSACSFTSCGATSCTLSCSVDMQFHTDPTDEDGGDHWFAFMEVSDMSGGIDFDTSTAVEVLTLRAIEVQNSIGYGTVDVNQDTGSYNPLTSLLNIGNESIDVQVSGTDMTDGVTSVIPSAQQRFATSTFNYAACVSCSSLSAVGSNLEVDLFKPTSDNPPVKDDVYWGIEVPFGTASNPHSGVNTFTAISD